MFGRSQSESAQTESAQSVGVLCYTAMRECLRVQDASAPRSRIATLLGRSPLHPDARPLFARALAERDFLPVLTELGPNWRVLREAGRDSVGVQAVVVVGPPGALVIAVADIRASRATASGLDLMVNGGVLPVIRVSMGAAAVLAQRLAEASAPARVVKPLVVLRGTGALRVRGVHAATIVRTGELRRWCVEQERIVSDAIVATITDVALQTGHWDLVPPAEGDIVRRVQRFNRLQNEITRARRRRRYVAIVGAALVAALVVAFAIGLA